MNVNMFSILVALLLTILALAMNLFSVSKLAKNDALTIERVAKVEQLVLDNKKLIEQNKSLISANAELIKGK